MGGPTLEEWLRHWIDTYGPIRCKSRKTVERYRQLAEYVSAGPSVELCRLAQQELVSIRHVHLEPALLSLIGARGKRRNLSTRSVRHLADLLNVAEWDRVVGAFLY